MCELFAISSAVPTRVHYSLHEFAKHGGLTHINKSGWGISFYYERDAALFREAAPAANSQLVRFIADHPVPSRCVLAHVRRASKGVDKLENTHPFARELGGRLHVFAHNGDLLDLDNRLPLDPKGFQPVGDTDSEHAFCVLMDRIRGLNPVSELASFEARFELVVDFAAQLRELGPANFLYFDGDVLFAHAHKRRYDDGGRLSPPRSPGLSISRRCTISVDGLEVAAGDDDIDGIMIASVPLSDHGWAPLDEGTVIALSGGMELARDTPIVSPRSR